MIFTFHHFEKTRNHPNIVNNHGTSIFLFNYRCCCYPGATNISISLFNVILHSRAKMSVIWYVPKELSDICERRTRTNHKRKPVFFVVEFDWTVQDKLQLVFNRNQISPGFASITSLKCAHPLVTVVRFLDARMTDVCRKLCWKRNLAWDRSAAAFIIRRLYDLVFIQEAHLVLLLCTFTDESIIGCKVWFIFGRISEHKQPGLIMVCIWWACVRWDINAGSQFWISSIEQTPQEKRDVYFV